jgi:hypothetical protein
MSDIIGDRQKLMTLIRSSVISMPHGNMTYLTHTSGSARTIQAALKFRVCSGG